MRLLPCDMVQATWDGYVKNAQRKNFYLDQIILIQVLLQFGDVFWKCEYLACNKIIHYHVIVSRYNPEEWRQIVAKSLPFVNEWKHTQCSH